MRTIKKLTYKDYEYSVNSIEEDYRLGRITREKARDSLSKLKKAYSDNKNNKDIAKAFSGKAIIKG